MNTAWFTSEHNRSERAYQTEWLVPALRDPDARWRLLSQIGGVTKQESDGACVMHFVWVLRDKFASERHYIQADPDFRERDWSGLIRRWTGVLKLPSWAMDPAYWTHPDGYRGDSNYVVHPVSKALGWTSNGMKCRYRRFSPPVLIGEATPVLDKARMVLNTECDCFIQTEQRLIVIECKDKTGFTSEQRERQRSLVDCLQRLLPRGEPVLHLEIANAKSRKPIDLAMTWDIVREVASGI